MRVGRIRTPFLFPLKVDGTKKKSFHATSYLKKKLYSQILMKIQAKFAEKFANFQVPYSTYGAFSRSGYAVNQLE